MNQHFIFILFLFQLLATDKSFGQPTFLLNEAELIEKYGENDAYSEAKTLRLKGELTAARSFYKKATDTLEIEKKWELCIFAYAEWSTTYSATEDYIEGINIAKTAIEKIEQEVPEHQKLTAFLYHQIGSIYFSKFEYELSLKAYHKQLEILQNYAVPDSNWEYVLAYNGIAGVLQKLGKFEQSQDYYSRAIHIVEDQNLANLNWSISTLFGLVGVTSFHMGKHGEGLKTSKKFLDIAKEKFGHNALELVDFYLIVAKTLSFLEEKEQSIEYYKKALFLLEKHGVSNRKLQIFNNLGHHNRALGNYDQALFYWEKYWETQQKNPKINTEKIVIATSMAGLYLYMSNPDKAVEYFNLADSLLQNIDRESVDKESLFHASRSFHWNYAQYWKAMNQRQKEKKHMLELVNNYSKKGSEWYNTGNYRQLAGIYGSEGNLDSAFYANQQAIIGLCDNFKSLDIKDLPPVDDLKNYLWVYATLNQKVWLYSLKTKKTKALTEKRELFEAGVAVADLADAYHLKNMKQASLLRGSNSNKLIETSFHNYKFGLQLCYDYFEQCEEPASVEKGFYYVQKMKSQNLWKNLSKSDAMSFGALDETLLAQERVLQDEINIYEKKLLEAQEIKDTQLINQYQNEHLFELKMEFADLQARLESKYPDYFSLKYNFTPETGTSLQRVLQEDELLIDYLFFQQALYIFTVEKNQPLQIHRIDCDEKKINELVSDFKSLLENSAMRRKSSREKFINISHELYRQFILPIENQITDKSRLVIIGDGLTNYIPFEVLLKSNEVKPFHNLDFLVRTHEISYHYSATLFAKAKRKSISTQEGIFAFAPVYDDELEATDVVSIAANIPTNTTLRAIGTDGNFSPLPESEVEVSSILQLFQAQYSHSKNTLALREMALESTLKQHLEQDYQFIHIAGHSFANLDNPKFSGIACFEQSGKEDGILFSGEIYNIRTKADLVTLSSCESGLGKLGLKEGLLGINRAFIYAGTPNVVFSLWKVYDKVSSQLMIDFYKNILEGQDYSKSLRQAKLNLLQEEVTASPHFWSPFLLIGR